MNLLKVERVHYFSFSEYLMAEDAADVRLKYYYHFMSGLTRHCHRALFLPRQGHSLAWSPRPNHVWLTASERSKQCWLRSRELHVEYTACIFNWPVVNLRGTYISHFHYYPHVIYEHVIVTRYLRTVGLGRRSLYTETFAFCESPPRWWKWAFVFGVRHLVSSSLIFISLVSALEKFIPFNCTFI